MSSRFSPPPLKPYQPDYHPKPRSSSIFRQRFRWLYSLVALGFVYLWYTGGFHFLPHKRPIHEPSLRYKNVDWSHFAYSQYATDSAYLCNAVMVFEALSRLGSKADRILLYPQEWDTEISDELDRDSQLLVKAREYYNVKLIPVNMPRKENDAWDGSFSKFLTWSQTQYERILHLDSDVTILKSMDELFMLPRAQIAMVRAYWDLPQTRKLTSLFVLLEPSEPEFLRLMAASRPDNRPKGEYDMDILNRFYRDSAMVLPHQKYGMLSGEFRAKDHSNFLGNTYDYWNADRTFREASLVHFSDWPLPKPWIMWPHNLIGEMLPKCYSDRGLEVQHCKEKEIWLNLYDDFRKRRKDICALLSEMAPDWPPHNNTNEAESD